MYWGTWVAQSVKHPTLDLSSGLDLRVMSSSPTLGSMLGVEPTLKKKKKIKQTFPFEFYSFPENLFSFSWAHFL